ncbi:MAG: hypothetical protein ACK5ZH_02730 [Alphaproteobacteria bacterium]
MKLKASIFSLLFMLAACGGVNTFDEQHSSAVIMSGPYRDVDQISSVLGRALSGQDHKTNLKNFYQTRAMFKKEGASDEPMLVFFMSPRISQFVEAEYYYDTKYVTPGTYILSGFSLANMVVDPYDSKKCGEISFDVKPNEIVYIGGLKPQPTSDWPKAPYMHMMPYFSEDGVPPRVKLSGDRPVVVRIPKNAMANPPADCNEEVKPLW